MHQHTAATPRPSHSRASTVNESPPVKRLRPTFDDNFDSNERSAPNGPTRASAMTPSSLSQNSVYDQVLMEVEGQTLSSSAHLQPVAATATTSNLNKELQPIHKLLDTTITVQYGEKLDQKCSIHLQLLADRSPKLRQLFAEATKLRKNYLEVKSMRHKVKSLLPPETSAEVFLETRVDEMVARAINFIAIAYNNFPLLEYQASVKAALESTTDEQFQIAKMLKEPPSNGGFKRKDYPSSLVVQRLQLMKPEAVLNVTNRLYKALWRMKGQEENKAFKDEIKAAAQHRIILLNVDEDTVGSLLHWVYNSELQFLDAEHLCKIHHLAERLGLHELAENCLAKLLTAASTAIDDANIEGVSLQDLLDGIPAAANDSAHGNCGPLTGVVRTVFTFVLQQERPPAVLKQLVIEAIANSADSGVIETALPMMASEMKDELCMALSHRLSKLKNLLLQQKPSRYSEESSDASVKSEVPCNPDAEMKQNTSCDSQFGEEHRRH